MVAPLCKYCGAMPPNAHDPICPHARDTQVAPEINTPRTTTRQTSVTLQVSHAHPQQLAEFFAALGRLMLEGVDFEITVRRADSLTPVPRDRKITP